ncbi:DnaJ C-terminal domain-containing protein [Kiritimatiellota bacterium B12222]|nr:DnaJ C-terminal domain-containing protein [Kiritimatiellota bacterium B12222]
MEYKNYYSILGVSKDADAALIKKEYRKLARKYHPDVNKDSVAEQKFKDLSEAYEVLKDPEKRKAYDTYGANWKQGSSRPSPHPGSRYGRASGSGRGFSFEDGAGDDGHYSEFFESLFGHRGGGERGRSPFQQKGEDMNAFIRISLEDAYHGSSRTISFETPITTAEGFVANKKRTLQVNIPKGMKNGGKIRLKGKGAAGMNGGPAGDLYIRIDIEPHRVFTVEGADLYVTLPIAPWEAALGAKVRVPTPDGDVTVVIPKGSLSGSKMRLKGKGIPAKQPGNLYITLQVVLPPADDEKTIALYEEMKTLNFNPRQTFAV